MYSIFDRIDRIDSPSKQKLHNFHRAASAVHNAYRTLPAPAPHPPTLRRMEHLRSADLQPQRLIKLQFRDRLCIRTRAVRPPIMTRTEPAPVREILEHVCERTTAPAIAPAR